MAKKALRRILSYVTFALASGFFWGASEAVINRLWRPAAVWRPDSLLESAYGRVLFYSWLVLAAVGITAAGIFVVRRLRRRPGATERVWPGAAAAAAIITSSLGWLAFGLAPRGKMHLARFAFDLTEVTPFFIYWGCLLVVAVLLAFVLCRFFARRRWWRAAGRFARAFGVIAFVAVVAGRFIERARRPVPRGPNVVLIILDAWRADAFREDLMPNLYKYAEDNATVFSRVWSCASWTVPSMHSIFTGQYVYTHRFRSGPRADVVSPTVAQIFGEAGYETTAIVANRLVDRYNPATDGFDNFYYWDWPPALRAVGFFSTNWYSPAFKDVFNRALSYKTSEELTVRFGNYLRRKHRRPFFLWVHYMDPHDPYSPPARYRRAGDDEYVGDFRPEIKGRRRIYHRLYEAECRFLDELLGADILNTLSEARDTAVIITSDHGEEFWEHNTFGHGKSVYENVVRVPLIISAPGETAGIVTTPVSHIDLAPTMINLAGLRVPATMQGRPLPVNDAVGVARPVFVGDALYPGREGAGDAIILWPRKLILGEGPAGGPGDYYDLSADAGENEPRAEDEVAVLMRRQFHAWKKAVAKRKRPSTVKAYGVVEADLRALGYVK